MVRVVYFDFDFNDFLSSVKVSNFSLDDIFLVVLEFRYNSLKFGKFAQ